MSSLIVQVCRVEEVKPHPDPQTTRMCLVRVKGWWICAGKDERTGKTQFNVGDPCVFFPPDSILPPVLSDRLGVTKYLSPLAKDADGNRPAGGRLRVAKLRGRPSYGLIMPAEEWQRIGDDVAEYYGITKWEPPLRCTDGDAEKPHPAFRKYTDIENIRNFNNLFNDGEEVVVTEKIHGANARLGLIRVADDTTGQAVWNWMAGSHDIRRKEIDAKGERSVFWNCFTDEIKMLLRHLSGADHDINGVHGSPVVPLSPVHDVIAFGERFGCVQDLRYGFENGHFSCRIFDICVDGKFLDTDETNNLCKRFGVPTVPELWRGPFSFSKIEELAEGPTTLCSPEKAGKFKGREGVVIKPIKERMASTPDKVFDRVILKCISFAYLERKDGTEYH